MPPAPPFVLPGLRPARKITGAPTGAPVIARLARAIVARDYGREKANTVKVFPASPYVITYCLPPDW